MRRKSERVSKAVVEKKPEKSPKKARGRTSRRRKKSASTSPESSDNEQFETSYRSSQEDTEEETSSGTSRTRRDRQKIVYTEAEVDAPDTLDDVEAQPKVFSGRTRRSSKKQTADEAEEQAKSETDDKSTDETKAESSDQKHKEKEGKSSVWQVKSADCSSGEIKKLKLCIVRPQEVAEQSPKKHKKSRSSRSSAHHDLAESEAGESSARDSSGERRKSRKSHRHASASDDSTSPDKGKGKHKSRESSEDGHRTQDSSEEVVAQTMQGNAAAKVEETNTDKETIAVAGAAMGADPLEVKPDSNELVQEKSEAQQIQAEIPKVAVAASQSAASSPDTKDDSSQSLDPFDQLTMVENKPLKRQDEPSEDVPSCDSTVQKPNDEIKVKEQSLDEKTTECDSSLTPTVGASRSRDSSEERDLPKPGSTTESPDDHKSNVLITEEVVENVPSSEVLTKGIETNITVVKDEALAVETPKESSSAVKLKRQIITAPDNVKPVSKIISVVQEGPFEVSPVVSEIDTEHEVLELTAEVQLDSEKDISEPSGDKASDTGSSPATSSQESKPRSRRLNRTATKDRQPITIAHTETAISDKTKITSNKAEDKRKSPERRKSSVEAKEDIQNPEPQTKPDQRSVKDGAETKLAEIPPKPRRSRVVWEEKPSKPKVEKPIVVVDRKRLRSTEEKTEKPAIIIEKKRILSSENSDQPTEVGETLEAVTVSKSYEKVTLKRSRKANADDENNAGAANSLASDKEAVAPRKRPWGSKNSSVATKKPVLSISSDSLKALLPEAKPLPLSEVELTPDEDIEDEGEVDKDDEMSLFDETEQKNSHQKEEVQVREQSREVKLIFPTTAPEAQRVTVPLPEEPRGKMPGGRKISIISDELRALQRSPSPPRHKKSDVLYMTNLVRPFTVNQIKDLLARTGTILEDGFWMDTIKSKCYVQYSSEAEAELTRKALHGVRWPASNPKQLCVDFAQRADMDKAKEGKPANATLLRKPEPQKVWAPEQEEVENVRIHERERIVRDVEKIDKDRARDKDVDRHERGSKRVTNVREWDVGKTDGGPAEDGRQSREDRNKEKDRRLRKDRGHRSQSPQDAPARKLKKKEEDAPAKLLDDLFRKTKLTPCIYWLPLTAEQIVVKEEIRRKHMAEHERRLAEMRKIEKERLRERMQSRPSQRRVSDRDKRSPKK